MVHCGEEGRFPGVCAHGGWGHKHLDPTSAPPRGWFFEHQSPQEGRQVAASKCFRFKTINLGSRSFGVLLSLPASARTSPLLSQPTGLCQFQNIPRPPLTVSESSRPGTRSLGRGSSS